MPQEMQEVYTYTYGKRKHNIDPRYLPLDVYDKTFVILPKPQLLDYTAHRT